MKAISLPTVFILLLTLCSSIMLAQKSASVERLLQKSRAGLRAADPATVRACTDSVLLLTQNAEAQVEAMTLKGRVAFSIEQYAQAESLFNQARSLARVALTPSNRFALDAQIFAAWNLYYWGKTAPAFLLADSVLAWEAQVPPCEAIAYAHEINGVHQGELHRMYDALPHFLQALSVRKVLAAQDSLQLYQAYKWLMITYTTLGDFNKALSCSDTSLALVERHGGNSFQKSVIYLRLGYIYHYRGEDARAIEYMQQARDQLLLLPESGPIAHATISSALAISYAAVGDTIRADSMYAQAVRLSESSAFTSPIPLCNELNNYGSYLYDRGRQQQGIQQIQRAISLALPLLDSIPDAPFTLAHLYNQLIIWHYYAERFDAARACFDTISTLIKPRLGAQNPALVPMYANYASVLSQQGIRAEAVAVSNDCLSMLHATDADTFSTWIDPLIASAILWNRSEEYYKIFQETGDSAQLLTALRGFDRYVQFLDYLRVSYSDEGSRVGLAGENRIAYETALTLLFRSDGGRRTAATREKAFEYISKSSSLALAEAVNRSKALDQALLEPWATREKSLRQSVMRAERERLNIQGSSAATPALRDAAERKVSKNKQAFYQFLDSLKVAHPAYHAQRYQPEVPTLSELQKILHSENQGFVAYFVGSESLFTLFATADTVLVSQSPVDSLAEWVSQFNEALTAEGESVPHQNRLDARYRRLAYQLYNKLLGPFGVHLPRRFVVATDGCLRDLAFDALLLQDAANERDFRRLPYLGGKHVISCNYSAGLLREMRDKQHLSPPAEEALVLAPFHAESGTSVSGDNVLPMLESSGREADSTARAYGVSPRLGNSASKDFFLKNAHRYRVIVLITHGGGALHEGDSDAWIALAVEGSSPLRYERLTVREVYLLSLNADLVLLSACETGLGKEQIGEGNLSQARAFAYAGAKAVINSFWPADDAGTEKLMTFFHEYLNRTGQPVRIDEALWQARDQYLKNAVTSDAARPRIWASFAPVGDMRPLRR